MWEFDRPESCNVAIRYLDPLEPSIDRRAGHAIRDQGVATLCSS